MADGPVRDGFVTLALRSETDQNGPMAGLAFDTLTTARRLKEVGMEESHAEAVAESLRDAVTGSVATKQDLDAAKAELREGITAAKAELREEIVGVKAEVTAVKAETKVLKWLMVFLVGLVLLLVGQRFAIL